MIGSASNAPSVTGRLLAINTLGGIAGSLLAGFVGIPRFGIEATLLLFTGVSVLAGLVAWIGLEPGPRPARRWAAVAICVLAWVGIPVASGTRVPADFLADREALVDHREGLSSNLAVIRNDDVLQLEIDRWWQGENRRNHQGVAAHIVMLVASEAENVLVIGVGAGQAASRYLLYPIERLDAVDIEPTLFDFIGEHFDSAWMKDPRVRLIRDDGRNFLEHGTGSYDVISLDVGQIWRPGVAFLYTEDFYRAARRRLEPGGVVVQSVPVSFFTVPQLRGVVRTFLDVFPQAVLWYNTSELLLVGSADAELQVGLDAVERLRADEPVNEDLTYSYWGGPRQRLHNPGAMLAGFLIGPAGLARLAEGGVLFRDDLPVLDYASRDALTDKARELPILELLREHLEPVPTVTSFPLSAEDVEAIEAIRAGNLGEIAVEVYLRRVDSLIPGGDYEAIVALLREALEQNPEHRTVLRLLGDALMYLGRPEEAIGAYRAAVRLDVRDPRSMGGLAVAAHRLGSLDEAILYYRGVLKLRPGDADTHNNLGTALAQSGREQEAAEQFREAIRLRPDFADARRNLSLLE